MFQDDTKEISGNAACSSFLESGVGTAGRQAGLVDLFERSITYLRISVTDQCNLRCRYCTARKVTAKLAESEILTYEELLRVVSLAVSLGIRKARLTGGEPLVRRNVLSFVKSLALIPGLADLRLTTNGVLLADCAEELVAAGVKRFNISLDTLKPERFKEITGADSFGRVWEAVQKVRRLDSSPVKLNMVALKGVNDDELLDFGRLSIAEPIQIRFIEFMPMGMSAFRQQEQYISSKEIRDRLSVLGPLVPVVSDKLDGPARIYRFEGAAGTLGFISPISHRFCDTCNRLRLTSDGKLRSCLLSDRETDLKTILRSGGSDDDIRHAIVETILAKPKGHALAEGKEVHCLGQMSRIGG